MPLGPLPPQAFVGDLRSTSALCVGDGIETHTAKWLQVRRYGHCRGAPALRACWVAALLGRVRMTPHWVCHPAGGIVQRDRRRPRVLRQRLVAVRLPACSAGRLRKHSVRHPGPAAALPGNSLALNSHLPWRRATTRAPWSTSSPASPSRCTAWWSPRTDVSTGRRCRMRGIAHPELRWGCGFRVLAAKWFQHWAVGPHCQRRSSPTRPARSISPFHPAPRRRRPRAGLPCGVHQPEGHQPRQPRRLQVHRQQVLQRRLGGGRRALRRGASVELRYFKTRAQQIQARRPSFTRSLRLRRRRAQPRFNWMFSAWLHLGTDTRDTVMSRRAQGEGFGVRRFAAGEDNHSWRVAGLESSALDVVQLSARDVACMCE